MDPTQLHSLPTSELVAVATRMSRSVQDMGDLVREATEHRDRLVYVNGQLREQCQALFRRKSHDSNQNVTSILFGAASVVNRLASAASSAVRSSSGYARDRSMSDGDVSFQRQHPRSLSLSLDDFAGARSEKTRGSWSSATAGPNPLPPVPNLRDRSDLTELTDPSLSGCELNNGSTKSFSDRSARKKTLNEEVAGWMEGNYCVEEQTQVADGLSSASRSAEAKVSCEDDTRPPWVRQKTPEQSILREVEKALGPVTIKQKTLWEESKAFRPAEGNSTDSTKQASDPAHIENAGGRSAPTEELSTPSVGGAAKSISSLASFSPWEAMKAASENTTYAAAMKALQSSLSNFQFDASPLDPNVRPSRANLVHSGDTGSGAAVRDPSPAGTKDDSADAYGSRTPTDGNTTSRETSPERGTPGRQNRPFTPRRFKAVMQPARKPCPVSTSSEPQVRADVKANEQPEVESPAELASESFECLPTLAGTELANNPGNPVFAGAGPARFENREVQGDPSVLRSDPVDPPTVGCPIQDKEQSPNSDPTVAASCSAPAPLRRQLVIRATPTSADGSTVSISWTLKKVRKKDDSACVLLPDNIQLSDLEVVVNVQDVTTMSSPEDLDRPRTYRCNKSAINITQLKYGHRYYVLVNACAPPSVAQRLAATDSLFRGIDQNGFRPRDGFSVANSVLLTVTSSQRLDNVRYLRVIGFEPYPPTTTTAVLDRPSPHSANNMPPVDIAIQNQMEPHPPDKKNIPDTTLPDKGPISPTETPKPTTRLETVTTSVPTVDKVPRTASPECLSHRSGASAKSNPQNAFADIVEKVFAKELPERMKTKLSDGETTPTKVKGEASGDVASSSENQGPAKRPTQKPRQVYPVNHGGEDYVSVPLTKATQKIRNQVQRVDELGLTCRIPLTTVSESFLRTAKSPVSEKNVKKSDRDIKERALSASTSTLSVPTPASDPITAKRSNSIKSVTKENDYVPRKLKGGGTSKLIDMSVQTTLKQVPTRPRSVAPNNTASRSTGKNENLDITPSSTYESVAASRNPKRPEDRSAPRRRSGRFSVDEFPPSQSVDVTSRMIQATHLQNRLLQQGCFPQPRPPGLPPDFYRGNFYSMPRPPPPSDYRRSHVRADDDRIHYPADRSTVPGMRQGGANVDYHYMQPISHGGAGYYYHADPLYPQHPQLPPDNPNWQAASGRTPHLRRDPPPRSSYPVHRSRSSSVVGGGAAYDRYSSLNTDGTHDVMSGDLNRLQSSSARDHPSTEFYQQATVSSYRSKAKSPSFNEDTSHSRHKTRGGDYSSRKGSSPTKHENGFSDKNRSRLRKSAAQDSPVNRTGQSLRSMETTSVIRAKDEFLLEVRIGDEDFQYIRFKKKSNLPNIASQFITKYRLNDVFYEGLLSTLTSQLEEGVKSNFVDIADVAI